MWSSRRIPTCHKSKLVSLQPLSPGSPSKLSDDCMTRACRLPVHGGKNSTKSWGEKGPVQSAIWYDHATQHRYRIPPRTTIEEEKKKAELTKIPCIRHKPLGNFQQRSTRIYQPPGADMVKDTAQSSLILRICPVKGGGIGFRLLRRLRSLAHGWRIHSSRRGGPDRGEIGHGGREGL